MILDPRAILHLMLVEFRWLWLLYFTFFQLIRNTTLEIADATESDQYTDLIMCTGLGKFNLMMAEAQTNVLFSGDDEFELRVEMCDEKGPCGRMDCSAPTARLAAYCSCSSTFDERVMGPYYLNIVMMVALLGPFVLLVVYCIAFKSGGFNGTLAGTHYIVSCQSVQNSMAFRTYCNFLGFLSAGAIAYGVFEAFFGGADGDREANPEATQNLIVSLLAILGIIRAPHRYGYSGDNYDFKMIREHRSGWTTNLLRLLLWDSTRYYEEYVRAASYDLEKKKEEQEKERKKHEEGFGGDDAKPAGDDNAKNDGKNKAKNKGYGECFNWCD